MTPLIPALLTTTSSRPNVSAARATAVLTCTELVTSASVQMAASPSSAAPARSSSSTRPTRQTRAPSAAKARAVAMPMLPSPPVMMAALPCSRPLESMPLMLTPPATARLHASARRLSPLPGVETSSGTNVCDRICFQYSKRSPEGRSSVRATSGMTSALLR